LSNLIKIKVSIFRSNVIYRTMSNESLKYCSSCRSFKKLENFSTKNNSCNKCLERARVNSKRRYEKEKEIKFFNMKENSILPSNLKQTIYDIENLLE